MKSATSDLLLDSLEDQLRNPVWVRQMELEDLLRDEGIKRFKASIDRLKGTKRGQKDKHGHAHGHGQMSHSPAGRALLHRSVAPFTGALRTMLDEANSGRPGRKSHAVKWLADVSVEDMAITALRIIVDTVCAGDQANYTSMCIRVGLRVGQEAAILSWAREHRNLLVQITERFKTSSEVHHYRVLRAYAINAGVDVSPIPEREALQVGEVIIDLAAHTLGFFTVEKVIKSRTNTPFVIKPTQKLLEWVERHHHEVMMANPDTGPMVIRPLPWAPGINGGYRFALKDKGTWTKGDTALSSGSRDSSSRVCHLAINRMQNTAWRVNKRLLEVVQEVVNMGGNVGKIGSLREERIPDHPHGGGVTNHSWNDLQWEQHQKWVEDAKAIHDRNFQTRKAAFKKFRTISLAKRHAEDLALFFPCHFDFRGRVYYASTGLNPQGGDLQKALLEFSHGSRLFGPEAYEALCHHGVSRAGNCPFTGEVAIDKWPLNKRVAWVTENASGIQKIAEDPLTHRAWELTDDPFQFLAWCFAYVDHQMGKPVHLACQKDGTCNGYQHLSALLGDARLAKAVNVIPNGTDLPSDIYMEIASKMGPEAQGLFGADRINRKMVKKPVMIIPYGGTERGMAKDMAETVSEKEWDKLMPLAKTLKVTLDTEYPSVKGVITWLQALMGVLCDHDINLAWATPSGFVAAQRYFVTKRRFVDFKLAHRGRSQHVIVEPSEVIAKPDAKSKATPNFLQALDAAHLHWFLSDPAWEGEPARLGAIHDCVLYHPNDAVNVDKTLRATFLAMYRGINPLQSFMDQVVHLVPKEAHKDLPQLPPVGDLDLSGVMASPFFFS